MSEGLKYDAILKQARRGGWLGDNVVFGFIYEDKKRRFPDGHFIHTSSIMEVDEENNIVKTRNSTYLVEWSENEQEREKG